MLGIAQWILDRNAQPAGRGDGGGPERALRGDMDEVGAVERPEFSQAVGGGQAEAELRITWDGNARQADLAAGQALGHTEARRFVPLARANDGEAVPALGEAVNEPAQRHGDAVDFGRVGFGYEDKLQWVRPGRRRPASRRAQGHSA